MEFVPSPIRFASDIFDRVKSFPTRAGGRLQGLGRNLGFLKRTALPTSKSASGSLLGKALGPLATAGLTYADIQAGEEPWKAAGRNISGLIGGTLVGIPAEAIPFPGTSIPGYLAGDRLGRTLWDKGIDDRGLSGLLRGKGWNNPFAPSPEAVRLAGDTDVTSGTGMANIPATVPSTGQTHKDFEIQQRQEQGEYIPPGMTTSAGVPVEAQAGGRDSRAAWLERTANSPAARAGVFSDDERWALHQKNRDFQEAKRTGTLDEFAKKYPDSQTAKRRNWNPRMGRRF